MKRIWRRLLKSLFMVSAISMIITIGLCIYRDHHITYRDGINEYVLNLLDVDSVSQSLYISGTTNINVATSVNVLNTSGDIKGKICWKVSSHGKELNFGEKKISAYDFNTWTNTIINIGRVRQSQDVDIELWAEGVSGVENVVFIISKCEQKPIFGELCIGTEVTEDCLQLSYFAFSGIKIYAKLWVKLTIYMLLFWAVIFGLYNVLRKEPLVFILIIRWILEYIYNQPYKNFNNKMGYTLWMYSIQKLGLEIRVLPGTILKLIKGEINKTSMLNAGFICQLLTLLVVVSFFYILLKKSKEPIKGYIKVLLIIYGFSPFFISYYSCPTLFLHYDILLVAIFVLCLYIASNGEKFIYVIPVLCACAMLTHEMFIILCFPWLFSYLIYKWVYGSNRKFLYVAVISGVVVSALFMFVVIIGSSNRNSDLNTILKLLQSDVSEEGLISEFCVSTYYTMSSADKLILDHYDAFRFDALTKLVMGVLVCFPMLMIFVRFFYCFWKSKKVRVKLTSLLFLLSPIGIIVACYKACDFSRWAIMSIICCIFTVIVMIYSGGEEEITYFEFGIEPMEHRFGKYWLYILAMYLLLNGMGDTVNISQFSKYLAGLIESL